MCLVEEEHQLGQLLVTHFGKVGIKFSDEPKQEGRIELRLEHQLVGTKHVHNAAAVLRFDEVLDVERRFAEELLGALRFERHDGTLDGTDAGCRNHTVLSGELRGVLAAEVKHQAEVLDVDEQQVIVIGNAEDDVEHARLRVVESEQSGKELRTHSRYGGAHGIALFTKDIPETHGARLELRILDAELDATLLYEARHSTGLADAAQVPLHIGHKARHTGLAECLGQHLQRNGLARTCGTGDKAMAVTHLPYQVDRAISRMGYVKLFVGSVHGSYFEVILFTPQI